MKATEYGVLMSDDIPPGTMPQDRRAIQDVDGKWWTVLENVRFTSGEGVTTFGPVLFEPVKPHTYLAGASSNRRPITIENMAMPTSLLATLLEIINQLASQGWKIKHIETEKTATTFIYEGITYSTSDTNKIVILFQRTVKISS